MAVESGNVDDAAVYQLMKLASMMESESKVYYSYYSLYYLRYTLFCTEYVRKFDVITEIIDIIVEFYGITSWSSVEKSLMINISHSDDDKIVYSFLNDPLDSKSQDQYYSVFMNDWIDLECNKNICRYIFKISNVKSDDEVRIGVISPKFALSYRTDPDFKLVDIAEMARFMTAEFPTMCTREVDQLWDNFCEAQNLPGISQLSGSAYMAAVLRCCAMLFINYYKGPIYKHFGEYQAYEKYFTNSKLSKWIVDNKLSQQGGAFTKDDLKLRVGNWIQSFVATEKHLDQFEVSKDQLQYVLGSDDKGHSMCYRVSSNSGRFLFKNCQEKVQMLVCVDSTIYVAVSIDLIRNEFGVAQFSTETIDFKQILDSRTCTIPKSFAKELKRKKRIKFGAVMKASAGSDLGVHLVKML